MAWGQGKIRGTRAAGWRRLALDPLGGRHAGQGRGTVPLRLRSSLNKDKGPCPVRRKRPVGSQRRRTLPWLNPSALAAHEAGSPRALSVKCAGPLTSSKTSCLLFPGSIVIFLRERARGLNESTAPKGKSCCSRAQHPFAKTIHSLVRSSGQMPSPGPQRGARSRRWRGGGDHSPPPPPRPARTIVLGSSPPRAPRVADAAPATRAARRLTPSRAPPAGKRGAGSRGRG